MDRRSQRWVLDALLGAGGLDILHPESQGCFELFGYQHSDIVRVYSQAKSGGMLAKAWVIHAQELQRKAEYAEGRGFTGAARDLYLRAALCYGRAQYTYFRDDPRKTALHNRLVACYQKVIATTPTPVERVEIPFEGKTVYATLHLPANARIAPCVVMVPGMDMFKEDWHQPIRNYVLPRGLAAIAIDGPGQGESLLHGLKATVDNYERAVKAVVDCVVRRPEVDPDRVVLLGFSMGSYWGTRSAACDDRIKAVATAMGCYVLDSQDVIFNIAQPSFKTNFMYMAGVADEAEFDAQVTNRMGLRNLAPKIKCPVLMALGEFDELIRLEEALEVYGLVQAPKELWVFDQQFHPLGPVLAEAFSAMLDWLLGALAGQYQPGMNRPAVFKQDGSVEEGTGRPAWWLTEEAPAKT